MTVIRFANKMRIMNTLGDIYIGLENLDEAIKHYQNVIDYRFEYQDWYLHTNSAKRLAEIYRSKGENDLAKQYLEIANNIRR